MSVKKSPASAALILCGIIAFSCAGTALSQTGITDTGVRVRDPFVLEYKGVYYMYGTGLAQDGYGCVYSSDLSSWSPHHQTAKLTANGGRGPERSMRQPKTTPTAGTQCSSPHPTAHLLCLCTLPIWVPMKTQPRQYLFLWRIPATR